MISKKRPLVNEANSVHTVETSTLVSKKSEPFSVRLENPNLTIQISRVTSKNRQQCFLVKFDFSSWCGGRGHAQAQFYGVHESVPSSPSPASSSPSSSPSFPSSLGTNSSISNSSGGSGGSGDNSSSSIDSSSKTATLQSPQQNGEGIETMCTFLFSSKFDYPFYSYVPKTETLIQSGTFAPYKRILIRVKRESDPFVDLAQPFAIKKRCVYSGFTMPSSALYPHAPFDAMLQGKYGVHRYVLARRSPVFAAMFASDSAMLEARTGNVVLDPTGAYSSDVFFAFIALIYYPNVAYFDKQLVRTAMNEIHAAAGSSETFEVPKTDDGALLEPVEYDVCNEDCESNVTSRQQQQQQQQQQKVKKPRLAYLSDLVDKKFSLHLLELAHRYRLQDVVDMIDLQFVGTITRDVAAEYYEIAIRFDLKHLLHSCALFTIGEMQTELAKNCADGAHGAASAIHFHDSLCDAMQKITTNKVVPEQAALLVEDREQQKCGQATSETVQTVQTDQTEETTIGTNTQGQRAHLDEHYDNNAALHVTSSSSSNE